MYKKKEVQTDVDNCAEATLYLTLFVVHTVYHFIVISAGSGMNFPVVLYIMLSFPSLLFQLHKSAGIRALAFD